MKHRAFINYMERLGYNPNPKGMCLGIAHMAIQAMLTRDMQSFDSHIEVIAQEAVGHGWECAQKSQKVVDMLAFLEGVAIYQQPYEYSELLNTSKCAPFNEVIQSATWVASKDMEALGGLYEVDSFCGVYSKEALQSMLGALRGIAASSFNESFALSISGSLHTISVTYDSCNNTWICVDANNLPAQYVKEDEAIVTLIMQALNIDEQDHLIVFRTALYTLEKYTEAKKMGSTWRETEAWKKENRLTPTKVAFSDDNGWTLLHFAAAYGDATMVAFLLKWGAALECVTMEGVTPLFIAAQNGHVEVVAFLLRQEVFVDSVNAAGVSPLSIAAENGQVKVVACLLQYGAEVDSADCEDTTPLCMAAKYNRTEVVALLLQYGAAVDRANSNGMTPLAIANIKDHRRVQRLLKEKTASLVFRKAGRFFYFASHNAYLKQVLNFLLVIAGRDQEEMSLLERIGEGGFSEEVGEKLGKVLLDAAREYGVYLPKAYSVALSLILEGARKISERDSSLLKKEMCFAEQQCKRLWSTETVSRETEMCVPKQQMHIKSKEKEKRFEPYEKRTRKRR